MKVKKQFRPSPYNVDMQKRLDKISKHPNKNKYQ